MWLQSDSRLKIRVINKVDSMESLMIAYESKINIFEEMRYFLMFYLNLGFTVCYAWSYPTSVICQSHIEFLNFHYPFWQECMSTLFEVHTNFVCNPIQINDREWLHIKFRRTCNAIFEKNLHKSKPRILTNAFYNFFVHFFLTTSEWRFDWLLTRT